MNHLRFLSLGALLLAASFKATAQDVTDALRFSYLQPQGTARSMGFGNATGSVGGDFSTLSINPAGIGIYRSSEIEFTPSLKINSVDGQYLGNTVSSDNTRFNFNSVGVVFSSSRKGRRYQNSKWKAVSFGIGVNRMADFNRDYSYSGNNSGPKSSTATDAFEADANLNPGDIQQPGTPGYLGYQAFLIDTTGNPNQPYATIVPWKNGINQIRTVSERGGINELDISFGGNYMEKLMLGATIGIPILNYSTTTTYSETALSADPNFNTFTYSENGTTNGTGINLKLGLIYKISDYFRIGAAVHTPTYYSMHDDYSTSISSVTALGGNQNVPPNENVFDYSLTTPWRGILSATGFFGKYGFISADYEYVNYSTAHFNYGGGYGDQTNQVNQQIKSTLGSASNIRVGAEGRITNIFMLRLGFDYYGNPYQNSNGVNCNAIAISGGFGFRFPHWFVDAALVHTQYNGIEQPYFDPYSDVIVPTAILKNSLNNAALTVGFKF
ncbi:MAG TPA: hypothetical protein VN721_15485 [Flavipsychrobacter sp.]|nr:hypothetical protein [Flavipsychrobacter sp.]